MKGWRAACMALLVALLPATASGLTQRSNAAPDRPPREDPGTLFYKIDQAVADKKMARDEAVLLKLRILYDMRSLSLFSPWRPGWGEQITSLHHRDLMRDVFVVSPRWNQRDADYAIGLSLDVERTVRAARSDR